MRLYVLDGGGALAALATLPHCGAVVSADDPDRVDRLLQRLAAELRARGAALSAEGYGDLAEYRSARPSGPRPPFLLVFADRYDALVTALESIDGGRLIQQLERLMRDGLAAGIRFVVTGDRRLLTGRLSELAASKIVLRLADRSDYLVAGLRGKVIPDDMPAGRGFMVPGEDAVQVAVLTGQAQGAAENRMLRELTAAAPAPAQPPPRVDALPASIAVERAIALPRGGGGALVGVGGDTLAQVRVNAPGFLVAGPSGRGRSTALTAAAFSLAADREPLILLTPARSPLTALAGQPAVRLHLATADAAAAAALKAALDQPGPVNVIADDADLLAGTPLGTELADWYAKTARTAGGGSRLLAAVRTDSISVPRGLVQELVKGKCGLVLDPSSPMDGAQLGARLSPALIAGRRLRGVLISDGRVAVVQVPELPVPHAAAGPQGTREQRQKEEGNW